MVELKILLDGKEIHSSNIDTKETDLSTEIKNVIEAQHVKVVISRCLDGLALVPLDGHIISRPEDLVGAIRAKGRDVYLSAGGRGHGNTNIGVHLHIDKYL